MDTPLTTEQRLEIQEQLSHDIIDACDEVAKRYGFSYIDIIGVLELTKLAMFHAAQHADEDDEA